MTDFFHMNKRTIKTGNTKAYANYIARFGKHAKRGDLVDLNQANFPPEARSPLEYFEALDKHERANGGPPNILSPCRGSSIRRSSAHWRRNWRRGSPDRRRSCGLSTALKQHWRAENNPTFMH